MGDLYIYIAVASSRRVCVIVEYEIPAFIFLSWKTYVQATEIYRHEIFIIFEHVSTYSSQHCKADAAFKGMNRQLNYSRDI